MKSKILSPRQLLIVLSLGLTFLNVRADDSEAHYAERKVVLECAKAKSIILPKDNSRLKDPNLIKVLHDCKKQYRQDLHACAVKAHLYIAGQVTDEETPAYRDCEKEAFSLIK